MNVIETYLPLGMAEAMQFEALIGQVEAKEVREMLTLYEERGIVKGKRETLLRLLHRKFGELPEDLEARVRGIESGEDLDTLLDRLIDARSLAEMHLS